MVKPLFYKTKWGVDAVLLAVHLINVSQLDTLSQDYIMNSLITVRKHAIILKKNRISTRQ